MSTLIDELRKSPETLPRRIGEIAALPLIEYALIEGELKALWKDAGGNLITFGKLLKAERLALKKAADAAARAERIGALKQLDVPEFEQGDHAELAEKLFCVLETPEQPLVFDYSRLYRFQPARGCWDELSDAHVSVTLQRWSGAPVFVPGKEEPGRLSINNVSTPISMFKDLVEAESEPGFFDAAPPGLVFEDLALQVVDGELVEAERGPETRSLDALPFPYAPHHPCPVWTEYLETVFGDADDAAARVSLLQQFVGGALLRLSPRFERAMVICGGPGCGKSTFLKIVEALFPFKRRCSVTPQQLGDDYHGASLLGAWLNLVYELPEDDVLSEAGFKSIVVGESIQRREPYGKPFRFRPVAAHLFAANELPTAPGATKAFWDRWLVVPFDHRFRNTPLQRRDLADLVIQNELPAVAAWAVDGALALLENDGYLIPQSAADAMDDWREDAQPVVAWANEYTKPGGFTSARDLHEEWKKWAKDAGHHGLARTTFGRRLSQVHEATRGTRGERGYACEIKKPWELPDDDDTPF